MITVTYTGAFSTTCTSVAKEYQRFWRLSEVLFHPFGVEESGAKPETRTERGRTMRISEVSLS